MRKFLLSILAMVCATAMAFAGEYTITFKDNGVGASDNTAEFSQSKDITTFVTEGTDYLSSIKSTSKIYSGKEGYGLKFSSSKANGSLVLNLSETGAKKITKVVATASAWLSKTNVPDSKAAVAINGTTAQAVTSDLADYTFNFTPTENSTTLSINATERIYVTKLVVTYEDDVPAVPSHTVTFQVEGEGNVELFDMSDESVTYENGGKVPDVVNLGARFIPADGWEFKAVYMKFNGMEIEQTRLIQNGSLRIGTQSIDLEFRVVFEKAAIPTHTITITKNGEGTVTIKDADNNEYASGDAIPASADLTLTVAPAEGWTLASAILDGTEAPMVDGTYHIGTLTDDQTLVVTFEQAPVGATYVEPNGSTAQAKAFIATASTSGAKHDISISRSSKATGFLGEVCEDDVIEVEPGSEFTLHLEANVASTNTSVAPNPQDLRYCVAYLFADWNGDGTFDLVPAETATPASVNRYGVFADEFDAYSTNYIKTNYEWTLDINHKFVVPADAKLGQTRIRVIYTEAWDANAKTNNFLIDGNYQTIDKGFWTDYLVNVKAASTPDPVELEGDVINSEALFASIANPSENSNNEFVDFKGTDNKTTYKGAIGLHKVGDAKYFKFDQNGRPFITNRTSIGKVKKVSVRWAPDAADDAVVNVLGMNSELLSAYSLPVAGATAQISKTGEVDSYEFTEDFTYVAVYLAGPTAYVADIAIVWAEDAAPETYAITIDEAVANGSLAVKNGEEAVASGDKLAAGTVLTLTATPEEGYEATDITANGTALADMTIANGVATGTFTMGEEAVTFSAAFAQVEAPKPPVVSKDNFAVKVPVVSGSTAYRLEVDESAVLDRANGEATGGWPYFQSSFTMMGWYKIIGYTNSSYNNVGNVLMGHQPRCHVNYNGAFTIVVGSDGKLGMGGKFNDGSSDNNQHKNNFTSDVVVPVDEWVNIAAVYNADDMTIKVYVNGELAGTRTLGVKLTAFPDDPGVLTFGSTNANCWVDEAALFNSALSEGDILVAMEKAASLNPACFYTFTETNGTDGVYANEGSMEYPAKLIKAVGTSSSDGGIISASSFTETAAEKGEGRELANVEYCTYADDVVSTGAGARFTPNVYVKAGSYDQVSATEMQTAGKMKLYWDKTDVVVTTNPDDTISVRLDYKSINMHSVVFIDFNRDGQFTPALDEKYIPTAASEAVAFTGMQVEGTKTVNSNGEYIAGTGALQSLAQKEMKFTLPAGIKAGDYRMRAMVTFNDGTLDACPELNYDASKHLLKGGIVVDMTLRVNPQSKRTITVASADEALGSVAITSPTTEGNSIYTSEAVTMKATATDADAYFVNWTNAAGDEVSTDAEYTYDGKGDASFTANFRQHYAVTVVDEEEGTTLKIGGKVIASGDLVDKGTELTVVCAVSGKVLTSLKINDVEKVDEYTSKGYKFTVETATVIKPVFGLPSFDLTSVSVEGEGTVVVAEGVSAEGAPTGATFAEGDKLEEDATPLVIATPAANFKVESFVVNGVAVVTEGELTTDADELEFVSTYADGKIVVYEAYVDRDLAVSAKFVKDNNSAIESIGADEAGDAEFFNLQGIRVARENLVPGIYIMRNAEGARKVSVK